MTGKIEKAYALVPVELEVGNEFISVTPPVDAVGLYVIREGGETEAIFLDGSDGIEWS